MEVGLGPGHIVLSLDMGTQLLPPPPRKGAQQSSTYFRNLLHPYVQTVFVRTEYNFRFFETGDDRRSQPICRSGRV